MRKLFVFTIALCIAFSVYAADTVTLTDNLGTTVNYKSLYWSGGTSATAFHAAITGNSGAIKTTTTGYTAPTYPAKVLITTGGTTADVALGNITLVGTDYAGASQTEDVAISDNLNGTAESTKIYATLTSTTIMACDGAAATFSFGTSADIVATWDPSSRVEIGGYYLHGSGAFGTENITFTLDSGQGAAWDCIFITDALAAATNVGTMKTIPFPVSNGSIVSISCANANARTWGLEVFYRYAN